MTSDDVIHRLAELLAPLVAERVRAGQPALNAGGSFLRGWSPVSDGTPKRFLAPPLRVDPATKDWLAAQRAGRFRSGTLRATFIQDLALQQTIVTADPMRRWLAFATPNPGLVLQPEPFDGTINGPLVIPQTTFFALSWELHGPLVCAEWRQAQVAAIIQLWVWEGYP